MAAAAVIVVQAVLLAGVIAGAAREGTDLAGARGPLLALVLVVALRAGLAAAQERYGHRAATRVIAQLRQAVLRRAGELTVAGRREALPPAAALTTLTTRGLDALETYLTRYLPQLLLVSTVTPAVLIVIWSYDAISGLLVTLTLPLVPLFMALVGWTTAASARRRLVVMQRLGDQVLDLIAGLPTLRALGREQGQAARVRDVGEAYRRTTMRTLRSAFTSALVLESLTTLSVALVAVGIGLRLVFGELDLRTGLTVLILAPEVYLPLRMIGVHYHASVDGLAAAEQAFAVLEVPRDDPDGDGRPAPDLRHAVLELDAVTVTHADRDLDAPHHVDLRLCPGEIVALVGASGAGKSTSVEVLLGLRRPSEGAVRIDGTDLAEFDPSTVHRQIAWIPQRPTVVPATVAENAWYAAGPEADEDAGDGGLQARRRLEQAAAASGFDDVVATLPQGWQTRIGHGGHGLSAGQRQRLALTRAHLRQAPLVVLDEPTAHLDAETELLAHEAIRALHRAGSTVLLVAHRPALRALADRVVEVHSRARL